LLLHGVDADSDILFSTVSDVVEEAIYNALCAAESVVGLKGRSIDAIDLDWLKEMLKKHVVFDD
jgi:D-aminopeptidase